MKQFIDFMELHMKNSMHLYAVAALLLLEFGAVITVMILPDQIRLDMAKDVGTVLAAAFGIVGTIHGYKVVNRNCPDSGQLTNSGQRW